MAQLVVRNIPDDIKRRLQRRAKSHGRSMEEEARVILREAVKPHAAKPGEGLGTRIAAHFKDVGFEDGEIQELRGFPVEPAMFDD